MRNNRNIIGLCFRLILNMELVIIHMSYSWFIDVSINDYNARDAHLVINKF
jgi:hypothetical protein